MQFWVEMTSKWGFNDGESIPAEAEVCRTAYCTVLNRLLEKYESAYRVVPFNRSGMHNWALIVGIPKEAYAALTDTLRADWDHLLAHATDARDDAYEKALEVAQDLNIDGLVDVVVTLDRDRLATLLESLK